MTAALGLGVVAGSALLVGLASFAGTADPPVSMAEAARNRGHDYEDAFREGYADRLWSRRANAAFGGGLIGAATSLLLVYRFVSGLPET